MYYALCLTVKRLRFSPVQASSGPAFLLAMQEPHADPGAVRWHGAA